MKLAVLLTITVLLLPTVYAQQAGQTNVWSETIAIIQALIRDLANAIAPTTSTSTVTSVNTTSVSTTSRPTTSTSVLTTSISTTSTTSTTTTSSTTTSISPNQAPSCQSTQFLRTNETESCPPVAVYLVDVGTGNTQYELANAVVDIYDNNALVYANQSLLQNTTAPYLFQLDNGAHLLQIYAYEVHYSYYPTGRYANLTIKYT